MPRLGEPVASRPDETREILLYPCTPRDEAGKPNVWWYYDRVEGEGREDARAQLAAAQRAATDALRTTLHACRPDCVRVMPGLGLSAVVSAGYCEGTSADAQWVCVRLRGAGIGVHWLIAVTTSYELAGAPLFARPARGMPSTEAAAALSRCETIPALRFGDVHMATPTASRAVATYRLPGRYFKKVVSTGDAHGGTDFLAAPVFYGKGAPPESPAWTAALQELVHFQGRVLIVAPLPLLITASMVLHALRDPGSEQRLLAALCAAHPDWRPQRCLPMPTVRYKKHDDA